MKSNRIVLLFLVLMLIFSVFANYKFYVLNRYYKSKIPYLLEGEKISDVELLDKNAKYINNSRLKEGITVVFIFLKNCSVCDKNIPYWKKIAKLFGDKISIIGVVLDNPAKAFEFEEKAHLNFNLYVPDNLQIFKQKMRIMTNLSQTILLQNGHVKMVKMGALEREEAINIISTIKGLINEK